MITVLIQIESNDSHAMTRTRFTGGVQPIAWRSTGTSTASKDSSRPPEFEEQHGDPQEPPQINTTPTNPVISV